MSEPEGGGPPAGEAAGGSDDDGRDSKKLLIIVVLALVAIPVVIGIVVVLAAVVGTFVLGLGSQTGAVAPAMSLTYDYQPAENSVTITHDGGDSFEAAEVEVVVDGQTVGTWADFGRPGNVGVGESIRVPDVDSGDTVRLVWTGGDDRQVISSYTVQ